MKAFDELVDKSKTILILGSSRLDFDCLGSGLVLKKYVESKGKKVTFVFPGVITEEEVKYNSFLPFFNEIVFQDSRPYLKNQQFDLLILIDGTNLVQYYNTLTKEGDVPNLAVYPNRIHIDHHLQHVEDLADCTIRNPKASSTVEVMIDEIIPIDFFNEDTATLAYAAMAGDTGNFRWNFTSSSLIMASKLLEKGARVLPIIDRIFFYKSKSYLKALELALKLVEYDNLLKTVFLCLPYYKLTDLSVGAEMLGQIKTAFLEDISRELPEYDRGMIIYEKELGRVSIRARGNNDRNHINIPKMFTSMGGNGGGHFNAAGADIEGNFDEVKEKLIKALKEELDKENKVSDDFSKQNSQDPLTITT